MQNENPSTIHVEESFPVDKATLYKAWTEPDELKKWWKPLNKQLLRVENDLRAGGKVVYEFEGELKISGEYKEVEKENRLVYSWNWSFPQKAIHDGDYLLHVQFNQAGNGSSLTVTQENFKDEHAIKPHREGWEASLAALKNYLAGENQ